MSRIDRYKFGAKNNWRRWQWNRITEKMKCKPRDAIVLYLSGVEDLDRREACRRGFRSENLIAVDRDAKVVEAMRKKNVIAMHGNINDFVADYKHNIGINVIVADFCCGFTLNGGLGLMAALSMADDHSINIDTVLAVNMLRGREHVCRVDRKGFLQMFDGLRQSLIHFGGHTNHRGEFFFLQMVYQYIRRLIANGVEKMIERERINALSLCEDKCLKHDLDIITYAGKGDWTNLIKTCSADFNSYKSSTQILDSVVMPNYMVRGSMGNISDYEYDDKTRHKINAALAVRAMRKNGKLPMASIW